MSLAFRLLDLLTSQWVRISGESMLPSLRPGGWARVSRLAYRSRTPQRFDVVRFEAPLADLRWDVKRVVGLPGELVELRDGQLFVDGRLTDFAITGGGDTAWAPADGEYVVLGDNRDHSTDSRHYGAIARRSIRGKVVRSD